MTSVPRPEQMDKMGKQQEEQIWQVIPGVQLLHMLSLSCLSNTQMELLRRQLGEMSLLFSKEVRAGD